MFNLLLQFRVINKLGYSNEEIKRFKLIDLHSLDKRAEAIEILRLMIEGKLKYCNLEIESKYGEKFIVESRIWFGTWNNQECIFGISKDMTKEQEALQKFTKIFNINPIPMSINNLDGEFIQMANCQVKCDTSCKKTSIADFQPRHFRGLELIRNRLCISSISFTRERSVFLG